MCLCVSVSVSVCEHVQVHAHTHASEIYTEKAVLCCTSLSPHSLITCRNCTGISHQHAKQTPQSHQPGTPPHRRHKTYTQSDSSALPPMAGLLRKVVLRLLVSNCVTDCVASSTCSTRISGMEFLKYTS